MRVFVAAMFALLSIQCSQERREGNRFPDLPLHTLVYGGDVTLGRNVNDALFDPKARARLFGEAKPLLEKADVALVNGEGVISSGGEFFDKGEPRPYMFRAHPLAMEPLVAAGVDVVTVGNNHAGDYGRLALREMLDRLTAAKIGYTGGGLDAADAMVPYYKRIGDTTVAIIGADFTISSKTQAGEGAPGNLYFDALRDDKHHDEIVKKLKALFAAARKHAELVFLTPHWGDNWQEKPTKQTRSLARKLIEAGCDGIFGHSAHWFQGVEVIEGKPVVYDSGNLVVDFGGGDPSHEAFLWEASFNRAGVVRLEGRPLALGKNTIRLATGKKSESLLSKLTQRSEDLGTKIEIRDGVAVVSLTPEGIREPREKGQPPVRVPAGAVRAAPSDTIIDELPPTAIPLEVRFGDSVELVGYEIVNTALRIPKGGAFVALYWRKTAPDDARYTIRLDAVSTVDGVSKGRNNMDHIPGDWILPVAQWPEGKIVRDWSLFRLSFKAEGTVEFFAGLRGPNGKAIKPTSSSVTLEDDSTVPIGTLAYSKEAKPLFEYWKAYRARFPLAP